MRRSASSTRSRPTRNTFSSAAAGWRTRRAEAVAPRPTPGRERPPADAARDASRDRAIAAAEAREPPSRRSKRPRSSPFRRSAGAHRRALDRSGGTQAAQVSQDRHLHLAVPAAGRRPWPPGLGLARRSAGRRPGSSGGVAAVAVGSRGLPRPELDGPPERGHARRAARARPRRRGAARRAEQGLDQERVRGQAQGAREEARDDGARRRGAAGAPRRRVSEPASEANGRGRQDLSRPSSSRSGCAATRGSRRPRNTIRPGSPPSRKSTRRIAASSTSRIGRPRRPPSSTTTRPGAT